MTPELDVVAKGGDDRVRAIGKLHVKGVGSFLSGGAGADLLIAGESSMTIQGGDGADRLRGGSGNDHLYGNAGPDSFHGGPGDDYLVARDRHRDRVLSCGPGRNDSAEIDRVDPKPKSC